MSNSANGGFETLDFLGSKMQSGKGSKVFLCRDAPQCVYTKYIHIDFPKLLDRSD